MSSFLAFVALAGGFQSYGVQDIVQTTFRDARFRVVSVKANMDALKSINKDFAASYRFSFMDAVIEEPFKMRLTSTVDDTQLVYLLIGAKRSYYVPKLKLRHTEDLTNSPGKRQTTLDFGLLTPSLLRDLFVAKFDRVDRESGDLVFDLTYPSPKFDDTSRHRVWVDPSRKFVKKRVWYSQEGRMLAKFIYEDPEQQNGVWLPTRCTVFNAADKLAGVTEYRSIKLNAGVPDAEFKL